MFATLAVGFFARPLGGVVFGHFGDRIGRKSVLLCTLLLMGLATMGIGLLPTYGRVGVIATDALVLLRFIQGFAPGGEATAAGLIQIIASIRFSARIGGSPWSGVAFFFTKRIFVL